MSNAVQTAKNIILSMPRRERVRLTVLRAELEGITRAAQNAALMTLQETGSVVLYRDDNTPALTSEDHAAALHVAGNPRHLVYVL